MRAAPADTQHNSSAALAVDLSNNSISNRRPDKFTADIKRQHRHAINARRHRPSLSQIIEAARVYTVPVVVRPCCRVPRVEQSGRRRPTSVPFTSPYSLSRRHITNTTSGRRTSFHCHVDAYTYCQMLSFLVTYLHGAIQIHVYL